MLQLPLTDLSVSRFSFPQILPFWNAAAGRALKRVVLVRNVYGAAMTLFLLAVIFPGSEIPVIQKLSTYIYFGFAATMTVIYQSLTSPHRHIANIWHFIGFAVFILGNAAHSLWALHDPVRALCWAFWLSEIYVEGAVIRGGVFNPFYPVVALRDYRARIKAGAAEAAIREAAERQRINDELASTKLQLERVNRSLTMSALAASIAHEVSQPLAAVVVNADAAKRWLAGNNVEEARKAVSRAAEDGHRAAAVISTFRRMLHEVEPSRSWIDVGDLVREALDILATDIQKHNVSVSLLSLDEVPSLQGEATQLRQVFLNLMSNAIDAMDDVLDRPHLLIIRCEEIDNMQAVISVEDSGRGIKDLQRVYDAFYTTKPNGMGVGLFISRMIVEAHNGKLTVKSQPGRTKFYVSLPIEGAQD